MYVVVVVCGYKLKINEKSTHFKINYMIAVSDCTFIRTYLFYAEHIFNKNLFKPYATNIIFEYLCTSMYRKCVSHLTNIMESSVFSTGSANIMVTPLYSIIQSLRCHGGLHTNPMVAE